MTLNGINIERRPQTDNWTGYVSCRVALADQFSDRTEVAFVVSRWLPILLLKCWFACRHFRQLEKADRPRRIENGWTV